MKTIKFNLSRTFKIVPEGNRKLTISECSASPSGNPTAVKITWTDSEGGTINETINLDRALWKISRICECALSAKDGEEMSIDDMCKQLKGKTLDCEVVHREGTQPREDGTLPKFANVNRINGLAEVVTEQEIPATMTSSNENPRSSILAGL